MTGINFSSFASLIDVFQRSLPRRLIIVFASVQTIARTNAVFFLETRRTSFPLFVDTQRPRPAFPGVFQEKAKCLLFGAHTGEEGAAPVSFGVAKMSSSVNSFSCDVIVTVIISKNVKTHAWQKEMYFICSCFEFFKLLTSS